MSFGYHHDDLVGDYVEACSFQNQVKLLRVHLGICLDVDLIHLFLACRYENVALRTLFDLRLKGAAGVKIVDYLYIRR